LRRYFLFSRLESAGEGITNILVDCQELLTSEGHRSDAHDRKAVTPDWSLTKRVSRLFIEDFSALRTKLTSLVYTIGNCNRFKALAKIFSAI
jgi:hypothetical protein